MCGTDVKIILHCLTGIGLFAVISIAGPATALADSISTFIASGTFANGATLVGSITIDVTTGVVTGADIGIESTLSDVPAFGSLTFSGVDIPIDDSWDITFQNGSPVFSFLGLYLDTAALGSSTLVGYSGGALYSNALLRNDGASSFYQPIGDGNYDLESGSLSLATSVPEPASLGLLAANMACLGGVAMSRRKRRLPCLT